MDNQGEKFLIIRSTNRCNNRCIMCNVDSCPEDEEVISKEEIKEQLRDRKGKGYTKIEFTGGEPTVRSDLFELVCEARDLGYERISITTNGQILADDKFCKKLVDSGLNNITISLDGSCAEIHDVITGTKGSFDQTTKGIRNIMNYLAHSDVTIVTVIMRPNYEDLFNIANLLINMDISHWHLSDMTPEGRALQEYESLSVRHSELKKEFDRIAPLFEKFFSVGVFSFPRCLFPENLADSVFFFDVAVKMRLWDISGDERLDVDDSGRFSDNLKQLVDRCKDCKLATTCGGIWNKYIAVYGKDDV